MNFRESLRKSLDAWVRQKLKRKLFHKLFQGPFWNVHVQERVHASDWSIYKPMRYHHWFLCEPNKVSSVTSINSINSVSSDGSPNATTRPGRKPSRPDDELLPEELYRRNRRRQRNREAAARIRDKRLKQTGELEIILQKVGFQRSDYRGLVMVRGPY